MLVIDIQKPLGVILFDSAFPKMEYGENTQKKNEAGIPLWTINVLLRQKDARRSENLSITVPASADPMEKIAPFTQIDFENLKLYTGENNGKSWISFHADKMAAPSK